MDQFNIELTPGNMKAGMKSVEAGSVDLYTVHPSKLRVLEGFNIRVKNQKYYDRVRWIADSIKANGWYKDKPITGYVASENGENVVYVLGGHRRHEGALLAISEGCELNEVTVVIKPRGTSQEDLTVDLYVGNEGDPITTYEQAMLCARLVGMGRDASYIAKRMGFTLNHVNNLLLLASSPSKIRYWVEQDVISASAAIEAVQKHKDKAVAVIQRALDKQEGKGRVTPKNLPEATFKAAIKKKAPEFHTALTKVKEDPGYSALSPDVQTLLDSLLQSVTGQ